MSTRLTELAINPPGGMTFEVKEFMVEKEREELSIGIKRLCEML
jgi:hypothetical protein